MYSNLLKYAHYLCLFFVFMPFEQKNEESDQRGDESCEAKNKDFCKSLCCLKSTDVSFALLF